VVPVKVRERDTDLLLLVADGAKVSAQISQSRAGVNDGDLVRIRDLQARGVAAELLKAGIADGDRSPRAIKLELHRIIFMNVSPDSRASSWHHERRADFLDASRGSYSERVPRYARCPVIAIPDSVSFGHVQWLKTNRKSCALLVRQTSS
jgi:hypothetical protein